MRRIVRRGRRAGTGLLVAALVGLGLTVPASPATAAAPPPGLSPVLQRGPDNVTADALPTVQIDGVVWTEQVVGNTVFAGGNFANARPAGAAAGTSLTPRANLLSFDITTGQLNTSFAPALNGEVKALAVSPDGTRLYVGGSFTTANGANRYRIAAYSTATGSLITTWAPALDATVNAISVTNNAVYVGGIFSMANSVARAHLAAFDPVSGALLGWAPTADDIVQALTVTPDGSRVIVGGSFQNINGSAAYGLGAVDAVTGTLYPWAANQVVRDAGSAASILSLTTDGTAVYSTAYVFGTTGNFEGVMSADPDSGTINWLADCHGDTYGSFSANNTVYVVSHQHYCANIGGFPDTNPRSVWHRATAFTAQATGTVATNGQSGGGYGNFAGQPSPSLIDWLPDLDVGTFTGQSQAAWSVSGNSKYVVLGGEFPKVNGTAQQGLVRFAVPSAAPNKQGPRLSAGQIATTAIPRTATTARITWGADWDRDDENLTYSVIRNGVVVKTLTAPSESWNLPTLGVVDSGLSPGTTYTYKIKASDADGNFATSNSFTLTMPTTGPPDDSTYVKDVLGQGASDLWRLDQGNGSTVNYDYAGFSDLTVNGGVTGGSTGAINGDADTASRFNGSSTNGYASTSTPITGPNTFTIGAWFATTSTTGGKIVGFGSAATGNSASYDRHIYMDTAGRIYFGVYNNAIFTIRSSGSYNDGQFHQVVATLSGAGMALYIDGSLIGTNANTTSGQSYTGYWRVGGDSLSSWTGAPSNPYFNGTIDDVAIYPSALTLAQIRQQYLDSGRNRPGLTPPSDSYGATIWNSAPQLYYRMDDTTGTVATDYSGSGLNGQYVKGFTLGTPSPVAGTTGTAVTFANGTMTDGVQLAAPSTYTEEGWFRTSSSTAGKLIGWGNSNTGTSSSSDRNLFTTAAGQLAFGVRAGGTNVTVTSPRSYNDGQWHYVAATQGPDGMALYVDGQQVATGAQTQSGTSSGFWRFGGDSLSGWVSGPSQGLFNGSLDEVAIYPAELTAAQIRAHYKASPAAQLFAPVAAFTASTDGATASFDGTGSSDPDGTVTAYAWNFGDGGSGTGATPTHTYARSGSYSVSLTVTDDSGLINTVNHAVQVTVPDKPPVASFTVTASNLSVSVDGSASSDPDGTVASYAWDFGDGGAGAGPAASHGYAQGGSYTITLTVTDDQGATASTTQSVTVQPANQLPHAAFAASVSGATVSVDASGSADPDGSITAYAWDFGDGSTGTGVTPTHTYLSSGSFTIQLTVTDNRGGTDTATRSVTISAPNQPPHAAFATSATLTTLGVDASAATDPDGSIAGYAWDFGDGASGSGVTASHTYAAAGTYTIALTVTDNSGATDTATKTVTVSDVIAADQFSRTVTGGWGTADVGGAWSRSGGSTNFSVNGTQALVNLAAAGSAPVASLDSVSATNVNILVDAGINQAPTGDGVYLVLFARHSGTSDYRLRLRLMPGGVVHLAWSRLISGKETVVSEVLVKNLTYTVGDLLRVRFQLIGHADGTTTVKGTVWNPATGTEPSTPQISATDATAALQGPGSVGLYSALAANATAAPVTARYDNLSVRLA